MSADKYSRKGSTQSVSAEKALKPLLRTPHQRMADAIRMLSADAVQLANSGHPGMPMGMADIAVALWGPQMQHLKHNPGNPNWMDRDRFVLSNGHGSMLLYSLLHLTGYDLSVEELRQFRKWGSKTPGHPEHGLTPGVETTTGPLGQGLANAVGMALAEKMLATEFNRPGFPVVDHLTWVFVGDGCLMEGISHEVCSLAGVWGLSKLIVLYDDNRISIDGPVESWFLDNTAARFSAYGWHVIEGVDGHDISAVDRAVGQAKEWSRNGKSGVFAPTLILCRTQIGWGAPSRANTAKAHGEPLGADEIAQLRVVLGWPQPPFVIPDEVYADWDARGAGQAAEQAWEGLFLGYQRAYPVEAEALLRRMRQELPSECPQMLADLVSNATTCAQSVASRRASLQALEHIGPALPELVGGSADLTSSNLTAFSGAGALRVEGASFNGGRHVNFGVREFGMSAVLNGMALHGGWIPYGGTFLVFSDYARNALRMAALMALRVVFVFTHDSVALGEDGPTHQPIEQLWSLRAIPRLDLWRPCDTVETAVAWGAAICRIEGPTGLVLSRQTLPFVAREPTQVAQIRRGGYVLRSSPNDQAVVIATGSEVSLALEAQALLAAEGVSLRVVSMPSTTVFDRQSEAYRQTVLPGNLPCMAVEAGATQGWWRYGCVAVVGLDHYGASAPCATLLREFGLTATRVAEVAKGLVQGSRGMEDSE